MDSKRSSLQLHNLDQSVGNQKSQIKEKETQRLSTVKPVPFIDQQESLIILPPEEGQEEKVEAEDQAVVDMLTNQNFKNQAQLDLMYDDRTEENEGEQTRHEDGSVVIGNQSISMYAIQEEQKLKLPSSKKGPKTLNYTHDDLETAARNAASATMSAGMRGRMKRTFQGGQTFKFCVFSGNYPQYIRDALAEREGQNVQWIELEPSVEAINLCDFIWKPFNYQKIGFDLFDRRRQEIPRNPIVYNHFENISLLSTKTGLLKTLKEYYHNQCKEAIDSKYRVQDTLPMAYMITSLPNDPEFLEFKKKFKQIDRGYYHNERMAPKHLQQNFWLLKPSNLNQGKGIEIFNNLKQLGLYLQGKPNDMQWIVQKYIERPLLYNKRKFDIRVMALGTNEMDLYFYETGYMRTSSDEYSLDNKNKFVHLTNNCFQKFSNNYEKFEEGNQLSFAQFQSWLDQTFPEYSVSWKDHLLPRIKDLVIDCFVAAVNNLNPKRLDNCFELMGFDFLIDEDFRVWLIEVNTNPYFGVVNNNLPGFISNLVDDTFKLTLDKTFPVGYEKPFRKETQYELLYCHQSGFTKRRSFTECLYPVPVIKEMLDKEREQMLQQKFPQKATTTTTVNIPPQPCNAEKDQQAKGTSLPNIVRSAAGLSQAKKVAENDGQLPKRQRNPMVTTQAGRNHSQNPQSNLNGGTPSTNVVIPLLGQSNRSKSSLSPLAVREPNQINGQNQTSPSALVKEDNKKQASTVTKFRNPQQSEDRQKTITTTRRRLIGRLDQSINNALSLGRPINRETSTNGLIGGIRGTTQLSSMLNRRGTTPAIKEGLAFGGSDGGGGSQVDIQSPPPIPQPSAKGNGKLENLFPAPQILAMSPGRQTHSKLQQQQYQTTSSAMHGTNLSVLLKKKNEDNLKANQQSQNEYLTKIQKMLKVKTIVDQVKDSLAQLDSYEQKRKDFVKIFSQIYSVFANPDGHQKKEIANAVTALRMMIYSQFIIHFNDKSVLSKLLEVLKLHGTQSHLEIKEAILKNLAEISKHHSIRGALLNRKLLSKIMKVMYEHVAICIQASSENSPQIISEKPNQKSSQEPLSAEVRASSSAFAISQSKNLMVLAEQSKATRQRSHSAHSDNDEKSTSRATPLLEQFPDLCRIQEVRILNAFAALMITLGSVSNSKFYIPGETKEVQSLRRKAIMNGILIFIQAVIQQIIGVDVLENVKDVMKKLQIELLETVDASDFRLHLYSVFSILKHKLFTLRSSETMTPMVEAIKKDLETTLLEISQERLYQQIKASLENQLSSGTKAIKIKVPHFLESLDTFITPRYLITTYNRYKLLIDYVQNQQQSTYFGTNSDQFLTKKRSKQLASANYESSMKQQTATLLESQMDQIQHHKSIGKNQKQDSRIRGAKTGQKSQNTEVNLNSGGDPASKQPHQSSLSNIPDLARRTEIPLQDQETIDLAEIAAANLPLSNLAARNFGMNNLGYAKSINHLSEKSSTLGVVRTISSDLQQPFVLPSLEPLRKQQTTNQNQKDSQQNPLYFMKLQPYLQSNKMSNRLSVAKKTIPSSSNPPQQHGPNGNVSSNLNGGSSFSMNAGGPSQTVGFSISNVKKQFITETQGMFGPIKAPCGKQQQSGSGLLRRLKNNINTQSSTKMPALEREQSDQTLSKESFKAGEDPYLSLNHATSKGSLLALDNNDNKKRPEIPFQQSVIQNQQQTTKSPKFNLNAQSVTESLFQAIKITDDEPTPKAILRFEDGSLVQNSIKE